MLRLCSSSKLLVLSINCILYYSQKFALKLAMFLKWNKGLTQINVPNICFSTFKSRSKKVFKITFNLIFKKFHRFYFAGKKVKNKLESVQRRFTKRLKGFGNISYAARLDRLKAKTLELRRLRSDLTMFFNDSGFC